MPLCNARIKRCKITIRITHAVLANAPRRGIKLPSKVRHKLMHESVQHNQDRRGSNRFPIECEVRYRLLGRRAGASSGTGHTINMSSSGVLFSSSHVLLLGDHAELSIGWPAQLDQKVPLRLVLRGPVLRIEGGRTAIQIQQYVFRTQASGAGPRVVMAKP